MKIHQAITALALSLILALPTAVQARSAATHSSSVHSTVKSTPPPKATVRTPTKTTTSPKLRGASARCRDGSYSYSQHRRGTCSHHGGVSAWSP